MIASLLTSALIGGYIPTSPAKDWHDLEALVTPNGVDALKDALLEAVPTHIAMSDAAYDIGSCFGAADIRLVQQGSVVDLVFESFEVTVPAHNLMRFDLVLSGVMNGEVFLENALFCLDSLTCTDSVVMNHVRAVVDVSWSLDAEGDVVATFESTQFTVDDSNVTVTFGDCAIADVATWIVDAVQAVLETFANDILEMVANEILIPKFQTLLQGMTHLDGTLDFALLSIRATELAIDPDAIVITAGADIWSPYPLAECVSNDPGEPAPVRVQPLTASTDAGTHVSLALGVSLLQDALYHMWRRGLLCITGDTVQELGATFDTDSFLAILPGFPTGTTFALSVGLGAPPALSVSESSETAVTLALDAVHLEIVGTSPDGTEATLDIDAVGSMDARIRFEPFLNALMLTLEDVQIGALVVNQAPFGVDAERLRVVLQDYLIPPIIDDLGDIQLFGPVLGLAGWYSIPRLLNTTSTDVRLGVQLYRAPAADDVPPSTSMSSLPLSPTTPRLAKLVMAGTDDQTPAELIRFEVTMDGALPVTTFAKSWKVGVAGTTATHDLSIRALDLSGNTDPSPVVLSLTVDGVPPRVRVASPVTMSTPPGEIELRWTAADDYSPSALLSATVDVYRFVDPANMLVRELVQHLEGLGAATSARFTLNDGGSYEAVVTVQDQAGNAGTAVTIYHVDDAASCRQAAGGGFTAGLAMLAVVLLGRRWCGRR